MSGGILTAIPFILLVSYAPTGWWRSSPRSYWIDAYSDRVSRRNGSSAQLTCKLGLDREGNSLPIKVTAGILGWHSLLISAALIWVEEDVHEEEIDERVVASSILYQHPQCHDSRHKLSFATETVTGQLSTRYSWGQTSLHDDTLDYCVGVFPSCLWSPETVRDHPGQDDIGKQDSGELTVSHGHR